MYLTKITEGPITNSTVLMLNYGITMTVGELYKDFRFHPGDKVKTEHALGKWGFKSLEGKSYFSGASVDDIPIGTEGIVEDRNGSSANVFVVEMNNGRRLVFDEDELRLTERK